MKAVILAGGKGTRLKPYTTHFPKPLMPIGDKTILEIVISQLKEAGFQEIILTIGHLGHMIKAILGNGEKFNIQIEYSQEDKPLGTAGPLSLLADRLSDHFLVMNGDVLCDLDFHDMFSFHLKHQNVATIGTAQRSVLIDFGVVQLDAEANFVHWDEKPNLSYLVSMGIYIFSPKVLSYIPKGEFFNLPDLIVALSKSGERVKGYIHDGYWLDIGRPQDYEKACLDFDNENLWLKEKRS